MRNRTGVNNVDISPAKRRAGSIAQLAKIVMGDFINDDAKRYVYHGAERLGQMRAKKIADHIRQSNGQCQSGKCAHADNPAVKIQ